MKKYFLSLTALMFGIFLNAQVFEFIKEINQYNEGFYMQNPGATSLVLFQNKIYFNGLDGSVSDFWVTDGTYEGTYSIIGGTSSVYPSGVYSDIHPPVVFGDKMIFT